MLRVALSVAVLLLIPVWALGQIPNDLGAVSAAVVVTLAIVYLAATVVARSARPTPHLRPVRPMDKGVVDAYFSSSGGSLDSNQISLFVDGVPDQQCRPPMSGVRMAKRHMRAGAVGSYNFTTPAEIRFPWRYGYYTDDLPAAGAATAADHSGHWDDAAREALKQAVEGRKAG